MKEHKNFGMFEEGIFKKLFLDFLDYKRGCGLKYEDSAEYTLRVINRQLNRYNLDQPILTKPIVEELVRKRSHEAYSTQNRRITYLRQFALFLCHQGIEAYVYPERSVRNECSTFVPYIFSQKEILAIFEEADNLPVLGRSPKYHLIYPVLLRMLYGCGLRLSEALCLKVQDVDLIKGILFIDKSKGCKSRLIPMSTSLTEVCKDYVQKIFSVTSGDTYFFPGPNGGKYSRSGARHTIIRIYARAGIKKLPNGLYPRVHDMRHTQAVYALEKMQAEGMDLYCSLPILSAYLGHKGIRDTEKYLRLPYFKFNEVALSGNTLIQGMIPEVKWDEE
jgi:integrase